MLHQNSDWPKHRPLCFAPPIISTTTSSSTLKNVVMQLPVPVVHVDEDLRVHEAFVSLHCPLLTTRLRIPAKGKLCEHAQAFELEVCESV